MTEKMLILNNIKSFLIERGWSIVAETEKFLRVKAPSSLISDNFVLTLPAKDSFLDSQPALEQIVQSIADLYDISLSSLEKIFSENSTIFSIRVLDKSTATGEIPFRNFEAVMEKIKKLLLDAATFTLQPKPVVENIEDEAYSYLNNCVFQQTEKGSFVAKIKLPNDIYLIEPTLFNKGISSDIVNKKLIKSFDLVVNNILQNDLSVYEDDFLEENNKLLNINILEDIEDIFKKSKTKKFNFSFLDINNYKYLDSGELTDQRKEYLLNYINFLKDKFLEHIAIDVTGKIVELRSRNPESDKNYILILSMEDNRYSWVGAHLDNTQYDLAIQAHRDNKEIRLQGEGKKLKTQLSCTKVTNINIA
ncbi:hypothetical protein KAR91_36550 [Candidatus Pacearchaeota archaeon]|nr:hypothetical protein [Candidatus Pacearchaeota archaeon]